MLDSTSKWLLRCQWNDMKESMLSWLNESMNRWNKIQWMTHWSCELVHRWSNESMNEMINESINQSTNQSIHQSISQSMKQPINPSIRMDQGAPQKLKVEVNPKRSCETSLKKWKLNLSKRRFSARLPSKSESWRCENEALVRDLREKL